MVYRLEDSYGCGVYRNVQKVDIYYRAQQDYQKKYGSHWEVSGDQHPTPGRDGIIMNVNRYFGFKDYEQLYSWFNNYNFNACLVDLGCLLKIYEVGEEYVSITEKQVAFVKMEAKLISSEPFRPFPA